MIIRYRPTADEWGAYAYMGTSDTIDTPLVETVKGPDEDYVPYSNYETLEKALQSIASMWPDPGMCAEIAPEFVGPNDGRMRADTLWYALNAAREALGLPTYPRPEHWDK